MTEQKPAPDDQTKEEVPRLRVQQVTIKKGNDPVLSGISFSLGPNDHLAITGASGSGKTSLALALAGRLHYAGGIAFAAAGNLVWVEQQQHFRNLSNTSDFYYQQRFNSFDSEDAQTAAQYLGIQHEKADGVITMMRISHLLGKPLIQLSNGENKKVQLAKALLQDPAVLVLDQPFVGLDADTRAYLHSLLDQLAAAGIFIILVTGVQELPNCITKVAVLGNGTLQAFADRTGFNTSATASLLPHHATALPPAQPGNPLYNFETAVCMCNVTVKYGDKTILDDINWEVKRGEKWLLSGPNGAGKSTLLSLITADNPQAYANDIYLFDRKRGSGESIWDIKKRTGFLSPELHLYFDVTATCFEVIASGLFDTIGLFRQLTEDQIMLVDRWVDWLHLRPFVNRRLQELSAGQQRVVLLGRALVKDPPLLVLDEPCQGLDDETEGMLLSLITQVCTGHNKTLIYVTHYFNKRPACIEKFIRLDEGRAVENQEL